MAQPKKDNLLGMPFGTASHRLRKIILYKLVVESKRDLCYRCNLPISSVEDLSIEHKIAWMNSNDPFEKFFDWENITFSHLSCNIVAADRTKLHFANEEEREEHRRTYLEKHAAQERAKYTPAKRSARYQVYGK